MSSFSRACINGIQGVVVRHPRIRRHLGSDVVAKARHNAFTFAEQGSELFIERLETFAEAGQLRLRSSASTWRPRRLARPTWIRDERDHARGTAISPCSQRTKSYRCFHYMVT